jgi:hypothetical protein
MPEKENASPQPEGRAPNLAIRTVAQRNQDATDARMAREAAMRAAEVLEVEAANKRYAAHWTPRQKQKRTSERPLPDQFSTPVQEQKRAEVAGSLRGKLMKLADLENMPPTKPLIKGILDLDSESWLIGQAGGFKSFIAVDWACHVAAGKSEWRGRKVNAGDVLYVVAEGARGFRKRVQAWSQKHGIKPERLQILPVAVQVAEGGYVGVGIEWQELAAIVGEIKPALIVLDTQARMTAGLEENSAKDMGIWVKGVAMLKEASGACVLVVHHTGRNGGDARGSSAIDAAQDMEWKVERKPHELAAVLKCDKSKDGDDSARFRFSMDVVEVGTDDDGQAITSLVPGLALDAFDGSQGIEAIEELAREGALLGNREWILRTIRIIAAEGEFVTPANLRRVMNEARVRGGLAAMTEGAFRPTLKQLTDEGQIAYNGAKYGLVEDPHEGEPDWADFS